ncbi:MAG: MBOAT family protein [bacterium]|nr:MBOAT family protein [bacterium]
MLFNSFQFAFFFLAVYSLYLISNHKWQNRLLLVASYLFYGAWDWRFLSLIIVSTILDFICGIKIQDSDKKSTRKKFLILSVTGNLTILGVLKYFNFFAENFIELLSLAGLSINTQLIHIILPVGISFYTFQTMSYTIDIYNKKMEPTKKFFDFALFVAFFPQLVAGPIERAKNLLPQILSPRKFNLDYFYEGLYLIFWGLYLKVFIADNLAQIVDPVFASEPPYNGVKILISLYAFAFQIFCDFAGYSNIARGLGRLLGFKIMINFNLPYFATNPAEFWHRWHISLSTWLRDYLYIPLGGNRKGTFGTYKNLALTMLLGGLWHGAAWPFIAWGAYQGGLLIIHRLLQPFLESLPKIKNLILQKIWFIAKVIVFFQFVCVGWLIFRAESISQIKDMLVSLFVNFDFSSAIGIENNIKNFLFFIILLFIIQVIQYMKKNLLVILEFKPVIQILIYLIMFYSLAFLGVTTSEEFIYFQF